MSDDKEGISVKGGYMPRPKAKANQSATDGIKGYQPKAKNGQEGQHPPRGGSNVKPPSSTARKED